MVIKLLLLCLIGLHLVEANNSIHTVELSPYIVFLVLAVVAFFNFISRKLLPYQYKLSHYIKFKRFDLPYLSDVSIGGYIISLIHLILCLIVGTTVYYNEREKMISHYQCLVISTGQVTVMNYYLLLLPSSKTSLLFWLTNVPFERSMKYHKALVIPAIIGAIIHYFYASKYNIGTVDGTVINAGAGDVAIVMSFIIIFFAFDPIKKLSYELFMLTHHLYVPVIITIIIHYPPAIIGFIPGIILHSVDGILKLYTYITMKSTEEISVFNGNNETILIKIKIDKFNKKFITLGNYFFINIPCISFKEWHPFSISSFDPSTNMITFHIKALTTGTFTKKIYDYVIAHPNTPVKAGLFGPYGSLSLDIKQYNTINLIAGGIGITPMFPIIDDILLNKTNCIKIKSIRLIWTMRDADLIHVFSNRTTLNSLKVSSDNYFINFPIFLHDRLCNLNFQQFNESEMIKKPDSISVYFDIYLTIKDSQSVPIQNQCFYYENIYLHYNILYGRPNLDQFITSLTTKSSNSYNTTRVFDVESVNASSNNESDGLPCILVCGPPALAKQVTSCAIKADVDFHAETFGY